MTRFWKMSGAGNDFVVLPCSPEELGEEVAGFVRCVCRRGLGVGADGVLFVTRGTDGADATLVHYNADGGRSDFCGNGSRCAARFAALMGFASWPLVLGTDSGLLRARPVGEDVCIEVPPPSQPVARSLAVEGRSYEGWFVLAGVPHFVLSVDAPETVNLPSLGPRLRAHPGLGPEGANVDFVGPRQNGRYRIRTFERGVEGETLACGSGAIATAAVLGREGVRAPILLTPSSGLDLAVDFTIGTAGPEAFTLSGEARVVFEGVLPDPAAEGGRPA